MELQIELIETLASTSATTLLLMAREHAWALPGAQERKPFLAEPLDQALRALTDSGQLAGYVILRPWVEESCLWIGMAFTFPEYRRQGVYRRLLEAAEERAKDLGLTKIAMGVSSANAESAQAHLALGLTPTMFEREVR